MQLSRWQFVLARFLFLAYVLFTSTYCLLAYIPFTYQQVHVGGLLPWLTQFVHLHAMLYWPFALVALLTIIPNLKSGPARHLSRAFAAAAFFAGIALLIHPLLPGLCNNVSSLLWSVLSLVPLLWLAAIDWLHSRESLPWPAILDDESSESLLAALWTAIYLAVIYFPIAIVAGHTQFQLASSQSLSLFLWSLLSHLLIFFLLFVLLDLVSVLASLFSSPSSRSKAALGGTLILFIALTGLAVRYIILPSLSLEGSSTAIISTAFALAVVIYAAAGSIRTSSPTQNSTQHFLDLFFVPFPSLQRAGKTKQSIVLVFLAGAAWFLSIHLSRLDWDFTLQKIAVLIIWIIAFATFYAITPPNTRVTRLWAHGIGFFLLAAYLGLVAAQPRWSTEENAPTAIGQAIDESQGYDISFRMADSLLHGRFAPRAGSNFFSFLADNTNIPRSTRISPPEINLVAHLNPASGRTPNIFIFVIDSLRRDYVAPYNSAVTFTPALEALGKDKDSIVFQNAFTRYGGTGLSEPSMWVGGMMLHQQYIWPFARLNSLQKLLDVNRFAEWISKDNILQQIVPPSPNINELDANIGAMHYDLCRTLQELNRRLQSTRPSGPIFVYTQPQNIHVSVIDREGRSVPDGARFPAQFDAAYASRVQRLDACLGEFLTTLKTTGLYENSIIVVTSDHGDSLGEHGRWGHAYTLFPEIVRIPLLIHLPPWMLATVKYNPKAVAFLSDLTPSLYYLLGQQPIANNPLLGRPLFTASLDEQRPYLRDSYLLASSYAPVYGLLSNSGRSLYIVDGVNYRDYAYQLNPDGSNREAPLTDDERVSAQEEIRGQIDAIAQFYGLRR